MNRPKTDRAIKMAAKRAERAASDARIRAAQEATRAIVATGKCPECGSKLRRNLSMTGWWQCAQFGSDGFRADDAKPACGWQGFTE
jgi:ribosomal protein L37AE/L43A